MMKNITFTLNNSDYIALCDLLKVTAVANSGGHAKELIARGLVLRNGVIEMRKTAKIKIGETICYQDVMIDIIDDSVETL